MPVPLNLPISDEVFQPHQLQPQDNIPDDLPTTTTTSNTTSVIQPTTPTLRDNSSAPSGVTHQRFFLDLFAGHSAPLTVAAKAANLDHFDPFDIEFNHLCNILDDTQFENLPTVAHSGLIGAIWSARTSLQTVLTLKTERWRSTSLAH